MVDAIVAYAEEAFDLENTMRTRMQALASEEFEHLLRTAFEEDEWKLIIVGAALCIVAGLLQVWLLAGSSCCYKTKKRKWNEVEKS